MAAFKEKNKICAHLPLRVVVCFDLYVLYTMAWINLISSIKTAGIPSNFPKNVSIKQFE